METVSVPYFPYLRGKQFDLMALRESADLLAKHGIKPIVEPVKAQSKALIRTIEVLCTAGVHPIVIVNPACGDLKDDLERSEDLFESLVSQRPSAQSRDAVRPGILLTAQMTSDDVMALVDRYSTRPFTLIHAGFTRGKELHSVLTASTLPEAHVFIEDQASLLYRRSFADEACVKVLVRDGFKAAARNADYKPMDHFSDLHVTYDMLMMDAYGDFQIIGAGYSDTGGPAYAVAIHMTYTDPSQSDEMFVLHFKSDDNDTPTDPAAKFRQAVAKLAAEVRQPDSRLLRTSAVEEFVRLHEQNKYPGLGTVKKLSIIHHFETLIHYHQSAQ